MLNNVIDISHYNTVASFGEVKNSGIVGVFHKATQGGNIFDTKYHARRQRALDAGLLRGAYHFDTKGNVDAQVENFLDTVNPSKTDLLVLDFEPNGESSTMTLTEAEKFVTLVKQTTGRFPRLYSGQSFIREKVGSNTTTVLKTAPSGSPAIQAKNPSPRPRGKPTPSGNTPTATPATNPTKSPASDAATATNSTAVSKVCKNSGACVVENLSHF